MKPILFVTLGFALAACAEPAHVTPRNAAATLTAEGYGPLRIGMSRAEVVAALGEDSDPDAVGGPEPEFCDQFRPAQAPEGLLVMIESGVLTSVSLIDDSAIDTDRGFGIGDPAADIEAAYGDAALVTPHKYQAAPAEYITVWARGGGGDYVEDTQARGIVYEIGGDGAVVAIRAGGPSIQYVEGCA